MVTAMESERARAMVAAAGYGAAQLKAAPRRGEMLELVGTLSDAISMLNDRIDELEKGGARFRGIYQRASSYKRGDQVTHKGSLWTALAAVPEGCLPGDSPAHWQLSAKGTG